jgi:predicted nucleic acid-binding protein
MPLCKNDPKRKYKGNEPSPKGLGWCAHAETIGKVRKGLNGNKWIIKKINNGQLRWVKYIKIIEHSDKKQRVYTKWFHKLTTSQYNTYKTLKSKTKKELEKVGINVFISPLYITETGYYIMDYAWDCVEHLPDNEPFIIIVLKINNGILELQKGFLHIQHANITYKNKVNLIQIFKKTIGTKYKWNGKQTHTIDIKL